MSSGKHGMKCHHGWNGIASSLCSFGFKSTTVRVLVGVTRFRSVWTLHPVLFGARVSGFFVNVTCAVIESASIMTCSYHETDICAWYIDNGFCFVWWIVHGLYFVRVAHNICYGVFSQPRSRQNGRFGLDSVSVSKLRVRGALMLNGCFRSESVSEHDVDA